MYAVSQYYTVWYTLFVCFLHSTQSIHNTSTRLESFLRIPAIWDSPGLTSFPLSQLEESQRVHVSRADEWLHANQVRSFVKHSFGYINACCWMEAHLGYGTCWRHMLDWKPHKVLVFPNIVLNMSWLLWGSSLTRQNLADTCWIQSTSCERQASFSGAGSKLLRGTSHPWG